MKKFNLSAWMLAAALAFGFSACSDDDNTKDLSTLAPDDHKANVEQAVQNTLNSFNQQNFVDESNAAMSLVYLISRSESFTEDEAAQLMAAIRPIAQFSAKGETGALSKLAASTQPFGPLADSYGIYTYDNTTGDFVKTASDKSMKIVCPVVFPVKEYQNGGTHMDIDSTLIKQGKNNIVLEVSANQSETSPLTGAALLTVDGKTKASLSVATTLKMESSLSGNGSATLTVGDYTLKATAAAALGSHDATAALGLKYNVKGVNMISVDLSGKTSMDSIMKAMQEDPEMEIFDIIGVALYNSNLALGFGVDNVIVKGNANMLKLTTEMEKIQASSDEEYYAATNAIFNKYAKVTMVYRRDKSGKIADLKPVYNAEEQDNTLVMVFADGSKLEPGEFFDTPFVQGIQGTLQKILAGWMGYIQGGGVMPQ